MRNPEFQTGPLGLVQLPGEPRVWQQWGAVTLCRLKQQDIKEGDFRSPRQAEVVMEEPPGRCCTEPLPVTGS